MARGRKWIPGTARYAKAQLRFLTALQATGNVTKAAKTAGINRDYVYDWRDTDPVFKRAWESSLDRAMDALEDEAQRRAVQGTLKPVYQGGKKVGAIREYSDTLLIFLLNGGRPEKYKHRIDHTSAGAPLRSLTESQVDDRLTKLINGGEPANDAPPAAAAPADGTASKPAAAGG